MSSIDNTDQTDQTEVSTVSEVEVTDFLTEPLDDVLASGHLFDSSAEALEWFEARGREVATKGHEAISRLLTASSSERNARGQMMLERCIQAQAAWKQSFDIFAPVGGLSSLKRLINAIRNAENDEATHRGAIQEFQAELRKASEALSEREELIKAIGKHLAEAGFISWLRDGNRLVDNREHVRDPNWAVKALQAVENGRPEKLWTSTLRGLLRNLDYWSSRYFREEERPKHDETPGQRKRRESHRAKRTQNKSDASDAKKAREAKEAQESDKPTTTDEGEE